MYFTSKLIALTSFLMLVHASLLVDRELSQRACGTANVFCGIPGGAVPCCAGLFCNQNSNLWNPECVLRHTGWSRSLLCQLNLFHLESVEPRMRFAAYRVEPFLAVPA
ncbi:hypothetical protein C8J57DRAFT_1577720 [Mycena rebaudengoi]|nr:hypothetical protein C8J57DRAFT_1577720 [Mycena rebaudengoi]